MFPAILGLIRHLLTFGGGFLVTSGLATDGDVNTAIGAIVALAGFVWSLWDKYKNRPALPSS